MRLCIFRGANFFAAAASLILHKTFKSCLTGARRVPRCFTANLAHLVCNQLHAAAQPCAGVCTPIRMPARSLPEAKPPAPQTGLSDLQQVVCTSTRIERSANAWINVGHNKTAWVTPGCHPGCSSDLQKRYAIHRYCGSSQVSPRPKVGTLTGALGRRHARPVAFSLYRAASAAIWPAKATTSDRRLVRSDISA